MKLSDVVFVRRKKPVILDPSNYNPQTLRGMEIHVTFIAFPNREKVKETQEGDRYMHRAPTAFGDTVPHVTTRTLMKKSRSTKLRNIRSSSSGTRNGKIGSGDTPKAHRNRSPSNYAMYWRNTQQHRNKPSWAATKLPI